MSKDELMAAGYESLFKMFKRLCSAYYAETGHVAFPDCIKWNAKVVAAWMSTESVYGWTCVTESRDAVSCRVFHVPFGSLEELELRLTAAGF